MKNLVVIGGGLVGMSAAYRATMHGARGTVIDQSDADKATDAGAGILSPGNRFANNDPILPLLKASHAYFPGLLSCLAKDGETDTGYRKIGAIYQGGLAYQLMARASAKS